MNGSRVATLTTTSSTIDQTTVPFRIGSANDGPSDFFPGLIDEVRVSDSVRYIGTFIVPQTPFAPDVNTKGLWHLDEGSGVTTADASGNGNSGTLVNSPTWTPDSPFNGPDTTPPTIAAVAANNLTTTSATVTWTTDEPATSQVRYGPTTAYGSSATLDAALVTDHSQTITGLSANTAYNLQVVSKDVAANQSASANLAFTTPATDLPTAPAISALGSGGITATGATVTWLTDVSADGQVEYGTTTAYGSTTALDATLVTSHSHTLTGLVTNTTYHYRVQSRGANGLLATSGDALFISGNPTAATVGQWSAVANWPLVAVHMALMPSGDVLMWDAWETQATASARVWNATSQTFTGVTNQFSSIFCSGQAMLADGRQIVVGGFVTADNGIKDVNIFNPATKAWTRVADMHYARWYPTATTLSDGRVLVLGGDIAPGVNADVPEVYNPATNTWTELPAARLNVGQYPNAFVLPNGKVFVVAAADNVSRILDVNTQTWSVVGPAAVPGNAVMYRPGKVVATGSTDVVDKLATVIDLTQSMPTWRQSAPMAYGRFQQTLVQMPDGKVLVVGGADTYSLTALTGIKPTEQWDPGTEAWTTMDSLHDLRMYHSTALLLPDGRVLAAGGGRVAPAHDYLTAEIFSPPYLFKGARPTITGAPTVTTYGASMTVQTPDAATITSVALVRLGSVTHTFNMDQRYIDLSFTASGGALTVQAPASGNIAPPGNYMLFILNASGVPSVASIVRIGASDTQAPTVAITAPPPGASLSGSTALTATATDNTAVASVRFTLDGAPLGSPLTAAPYSLAWDTTATANGPHTLGAQATDTAGNTATAPTIPVTVANPPVISAVATTGITATGATITWTTNIAATTQVEYGASTSYESITTLNSALTTGHSQPLTGLLAGTLYHYRVLSTDGTGVTGTSGDFTMTTPQAATPTNTPVPPTNTPTRTNTPSPSTSTPVPPTNTPRPPTNTSSPPTNTPVPPTATSTPGTPPLLVGNKAVETQRDSNAAGTAEAFQYTATASGAVTRLYVYIDSGSTATQVEVGLYANATGNNPGTLLAQGTISNPTKGAWNSVTVPSVAIASGTSYWIAILGPVGSGTVQFRDKAVGGKAQTSAQTNLVALPTTWTPGATYANAPMSAYGA